ncbi:MAG: heterodisulfide reductase, subunit B [Candidatus Eisenbacteria bacterium]|nr:heterodisulfide reductase, subunit B [Candidatus Eisenbacteria bacterium]
MRSIPYYPGCTLTQTARNLDQSARAVMEKLGLRLEELPQWHCCGTVATLSTDNVMYHVAPVRVLVQAQKMGSRKLATLCSMCYNTLQRSNLHVREDEDHLQKINSFMDREPDYDGGVEVLHLLQVLRDEIGFDGIREKVSRALDGLKVSCYYGCLLTRPKEIAIDDADGPHILEDLMEALGAEPIEDPFALECCGAYHVVEDRKLVTDCSQRILASAVRRGADLIVTSCPLCHYNLEVSQNGGAPEVPILYFTQLLALALGIDADACSFDIHEVDPRVLLREKGLMVGG